MRKEMSTTKMSMKKREAGVENGVTREWWP
jgi:hypothetical protein